MGNILTKVKKTMYPETWCVAYRKISGDGDCLLNDTNSPFTVLPNTEKLWCADPFLYEKDSRLYVFFEALDFMKRKGLLGYREITEGNVGDINVFFEGESHLSFPFIYEENGKLFIIPESSHTGKLFRLKCTDFPAKWEYDCDLLSERLVDSVILDTDNRRYLISQRVDDSNTYDRMDLFYFEKGKFCECNNPVKRDLSNARSAGKIFSYNGQLIRPSQDCSEAYGGKLNFNRILSVGFDGVEEEIIKTVTAEDIKTDTDTEFCGIHTYNRLGNYEVIDLKLPSKFSIRNSAGAALKLFRGN